MKGNFSARLLGLPLLAACSTVSAAGVVMTDDFSDSKSGWPSSGPTRTSELGFAVYADGDYQLTPVADEVFGYVPAPKQSESPDVKVEADMYLLAGVGKGVAGLACRVADAENFYGFIAHGDGGVMIIKVSKGKFSTLASGRIKSLMAGMIDTRLTASCLGDALRLTAKGGASLSANDAELTKGSAGLIIMGEKAAGTMATFDNFSLSTLGR